MPEEPSSNVKIYPRPEKKTPSPILLVISVLFLVIAGIFAYRYFVPVASAPTKTTSLIMPHNVAVSGANQRVILPRSATPQEG